MLEGDNPMQRRLVSFFILIVLAAFVFAEAASADSQEGVRIGAGSLIHQKLNAADPPENTPTDDELDIYYAGTKEAWDTIWINQNNSDLSSAILHYDTDHICQLSQVPAKEPSYAERGNNAYWQCSSCNRVYQDALGRMETTVEEVTLPKLPSKNFGTCGEKLTWVLSEDGVLGVYGTGAMEDYLSCTNTPWYENRFDIKTVFLGDGITSVGDSAFYSCSGITAVTIPGSVTRIGQNAFRGCSSLVTLTIPNGVVSIDRNAFYGCTHLVDVAIPEGVTEIGEYAFCGCSSLASMTIPDSVTSVGNAAFYGCTSLTGIAISNGVTNIGQNTFNGCKSLTYLAMSENITSIGANAFSGCKNLTSVELPETIVSIGLGAYKDCTGLTDVYYGGSYLTWGYVTIGQLNDCLLNAARHDLGKAIYFNLDSDGVWRSYSDEGWDSSVNGIKNVNGTYMLFRDGVFDASFTGIYDDRCYVSEGYLITWYTGLYQDSQGDTVFVENGWIDTGYNGIYDTGTDMIYLKNGRFDPTFTGVYEDGTGDACYVYNGYLVDDFTGLYYAEDGDVFYLYCGWLVTWYNGLYIDGDNTFLLKDGRLDAAFEGIFEDGTGDACFIYQGKLVDDFTGLYYGDDGSILYLYEGWLLTWFNDLYLADEGCYLLKNGRWDSSYTGTFTNASGNWNVVNGMATKAE